MNEDDDDDLPVLTQILRTGNARPPDGHDRVIGGDAATSEDTLMADQLVIGHEPHRGIDGYLVPSFHVTGADHPHAESHPFDVAHQPDSFALPQDHEGPHGSGGHGFDEPHLAAAALPETGPQEDPEVFAMRVRDAVLENLSGRIETDLDARVAQAIHAEVETALAQLQANLRSQVAEALRDVVGRAVDEEIARLRDPAGDSA